MSNSNSSTTQYKVKKEELVLLRSKYQDRTFAEELDYLESLGGDTFANTLSVDYSKGISQSEVASRRAQYGSAAGHEPKSLLSYIREQSEDPMLKAILILSIISILIKIAVKGSDAYNWNEGFLTLLAVIPMIFIGSIAQRQREANYNLLERTDRRVSAWRDGDMTFVYISELVTGDIVKITPGMVISADMLLIEVDELCNITTAESHYTGEPCSMPKRTFSDCIKQRDEIIAGGKKDSISRNDVCSPVLLTGTKVLSGNGKAIVLLVNEFSFSERVKSLCQDMGDFCQLQMKVENIVGNLRKIVLGAAAIIFLVLVIKFFIERVRTGTLSEGAQYVQFIDFLMIMISIIITAIPRALPLAVTSIMTNSIYRMRLIRPIIFVRKFKDLEYLGAVNSICCSITGSTEDYYKTLKDAGIRLRIVTDKRNVETITKELTSIESGTEENVCMTGNEFLELVGDIVCKRCKTKDCDCPTTKEAALKSGREMRVDEIANFDAFARVCDQLHVLTKSHSDAKAALVVGLKQRGDTVAVTADGTDDISVLRKADVRLALKSSKEIVQEAAGIVLVDNSLNTLVEAVTWSRSIYDNIRKYLQFQLTATLVVVSINLVSAFTCSQPLFSPFNLSLISFLFELCGSIALEHDEPSREVLKRKPYNINEDIISGMMLKQILGQALFQLVFLMGVAFSVPDSKNFRFYQPFALSMTFVSCQILNIFNCRKIHGEINVFSGLPIGLVLLGILYLLIFMWPLYKITGLFHSTVVICLASLTFLWPVIMKLHSRTRKLSKAHEKTE